jgi:pilus assembly protein CpaB
VKIGTMLILLVAILAGGIAAFMARAIIQRQSAHAPAVAQSTIVVAGQGLDFGMVLSPENVSEVPWSSPDLPEGAFKTSADLLKDGRRVVLSKIEKNEPVLASRVTGPGQRGSLSALIDPGMRAVTVRVDDVRGVAGFLVPGDHVDVVLTRIESGGPGAAANSYTDVLLQNVKVLGVDQIASSSEDKPTVAKAVTVEVTTEQAQKLVLAGGVGSLSLVLRQAGGMEADPTRRVSLPDLGQAEFNGGNKDEGALARRVKELEAKLLDEMNKPVKGAQAAAASTTSSIRVIRAAKSEDYNVYQEAN